MLQFRLTYRIDGQDQEPKILKSEADVFVEMMDVFSEDWAFDMEYAASRAKAGDILCDDEDMLLECIDVYDPMDDSTDMLLLIYTRR